MEKVSLFAHAIIAADVIVAKMITHSLPIYLGQTLIDVCDRQIQESETTHSEGILLYYLNIKNNHHISSIYYF